MQQTDDGPEGAQRAPRRGWTGPQVALALAALALASLLLWTTDRITLQGERTVFTVVCEQGSWSGSVCSGRLGPGPRYAFRASKSRQEVIYWIRGSDAPSGKLSECTVADRDNWTCKAVADAKPATIAFGMAKGHPTRAGEGQALPFHSVPKWKWWLIDAGFGGFRKARD